MYAMNCIKNGIHDIYLYIYMCVCVYVYACVSVSVSVRVSERDMTVFSMDA